MSLPCPTDDDLTVALQPGAAVWWDRRLFQGGDSPSTPCPAVIDVTGRPRALAFGPYVDVCAGRWRAEVAIEVCADAARRFYAVEFGAGEAYARYDFQPRTAGVHRIAIEHAFPVAAPAEIRLWLIRAAFHGELKFKGVRIEHMDGSATTTLAQTPERLG